MHYYMGLFKLNTIQFEEAYHARTWSGLEAGALQVARITGMHSKSSRCGPHGRVEYLSVARGLLPPQARNGPCK